MEPIYNYGTDALQSGQICLIRCYEHNTLMGMVLPWDNLHALGLAGVSFASLGLLESAPSCVRVNTHATKVMGWADGYRDEDLGVCDRIYPVWLFDGDEVP